VPNIVGMSFNEASSQLQHMNLKLRRFREAPSEQYAEGVVLSVQPGVGREIKEDSFVEATVSSGSKFVQVPDLVGKPLDEARRLLASMGLTVSPSVRYVKSERIAEGRVVSQDPAKHTQVERKTPITLQVSEGPPPIEEFAPPGSGYVYHLNWKMPDIPDPILVRVEMSDNEGSRVIFEEEKGPNERVEITAEGVGKQAVFRIYYDNQLVQTVTKNANDEDGGVDLGPPDIGRGDGGTP
jgi:serine/threonine-protein kinase